MTFMGNELAVGAFARGSHGVQRTESKARWPRTLVQPGESPLCAPRQIVLRQRRVDHIEERGLRHARCRGLEAVLRRLDVRHLVQQGAEAIGLGDSASMEEWCEVVPVASTRW